MPADSIAHPDFDASILSQLACPVCLGALSHEESRLLCVTCGRAYPIIDGIPVLIADRTVAGQVFVPGA